MAETKYRYRFLAKIVIEAATPLSICSGVKNIITDSMIIKDCNGLPYIPGTSIAGVVRHYLDNKENAPDLFDNQKFTKFFGYQIPFKDNNGEGSQIIFSDAKLVGADGKAVDGLKSKKELSDPFLKNYLDLPVRQHCRISHRGVAADKGKFDEQIVFAGSRFCFEIEMVAKDKTADYEFFSVLNVINSEMFRIGGGTRKGFGAVQVAEPIKTAFLDLCEKDQLQAYIDKSSDLADDWYGYQKYPSDYKPQKDTAGWIKYSLKLIPESFFLFGSGFADSEVDMTPVKGFKIFWDKKTGKNPNLETEDIILIPATSLKGAISHRTAFHWNKDNNSKLTGTDNPAVAALFGSEGKGQNAEGQSRGNVIFSDVIKVKESGTSSKILNHVAIDRFTGGAIDGALFSEKTLYGKNEVLETELFVSPDISGVYIAAFEKTLDDIVNGLLPLGGGVNRGNGVFGGSWTKTNGGF
jgi:CRISPR/Cas system CSM-associated protein Csm3 (group 7 of RAMP superfamily)